MLLGAMSVPQQKTIIMYIVRLVPKAGVYTSVIWLMERLHSSLVVGYFPVIKNVKDVFTACLTRYGIGFRRLVSLNIFELAVGMRWHISTLVTWLHY